MSSSTLEIWTWKVLEDNYQGKQRDVVVPSRDPVPGVDGPGSWASAEDYVATIVPEQGQQPQEQQMQLRKAPRRALAPPPGRILGRGQVRAGAAPLAGVPTTLLQLCQPMLPLVPFSHRSSLPQCPFICLSSHYLSRDGHVPSPCRPQGKSGALVELSSCWVRAHPTRSVSLMSKKKLKPGRGGAQCWAGLHFHPFLR